MNKKRGKIFRKNRKAQVWIETVIYTLIAFVLIGLVLSVVKPQIEKIRDKAVIEQTMDMMNYLNTRILSAVQGGPGNKRIDELKIKKGELKIDGVDNKIIFEMESKSVYSEPGQDVAYGNIIVRTEKKGKINIVTLTTDYSKDYNLTFENKDKVKLISKSSVPYKLVISNKGGEKTVIDFSMDESGGGSTSMAYVPECEGDDDCEEEDNGACVGGNCRECAGSSYCDSGYVCVNNNCVEETECDDDGDCSGDDICDVDDNVCIGCRTDSCPGEDFCVDEVCVECITGSCPSGETCIGGVCICVPDCAGKVCGDSDDCAGICDACPSGETCVDGTCEGSANCGDGTCDAGETCSTCVSDCACPSSETCSAGVCETSCTNDCSTIGEKDCWANNILTCGEYDEDDCLDWGDYFDCSPGTCNLGDTECTEVEEPCAPGDNDNGDGTCTGTYYVGAGDGSIMIMCMTSWASCVTSSTGDSADYTAGVLGVAAGNAYFNMLSRGFFPIDTSELPDTTITDAIFHFYAEDYGTQDYGLVLVQTSQDSVTSLSTSDFTKIGTVSGGSTFLTLSSPRWESINLNPTGLSWISKTSWTKIGLREEYYDLQGNTPPAYTLRGANIHTYESGSQKPYLEINYNK